MAGSTACKSSLTSVENRIRLKAKSDFCVMFDSNAVAICSGTKGVPVTDGVLVSVGVRVRVGVSVMVGVSVIVGVSEGVSVGGK